MRSTLPRAASIAIFVGTNSSIGGNGIINQSGFWPAKLSNFLGTPAVTALSVNFNGEFVGSGRRTRRRGPVGWRGDER